MSPELDKQLCEKYPKLFKQRNMPMAQTAMCWGFECGDGWYDLIDRLCGTIQNYIDHNGHLGVPQVEVVQVKEKFGTLRFYTHGGNEKIDGMIWFAQDMSGRICETCGKPGSFRGNGWYYTACDEHTHPEDKDNDVQDPS